MDAAHYSVRVGRHLHVEAGVAFAAFLEPAQARHFLFATPAGRMLVAELERRIGGHYTFIDEREGLPVEHTGTYLEIDPPHRLAFTLQVRQYSPATDRIVIDIGPRGGGCDLVITHQLQAGAGLQVERTRRGWASMLERLAQLLRGPAV